MNPRPFIATNINLCDENKYSSTPNNFNGHPIIVTQEGNRRISDTLTTSVYAEQRSLGITQPTAISPPKLAGSTYPFEKQLVPGGVVFSSTPMSYNVPQTTTIPSFSSPPPSQLSPQPQQPLSPTTMQIPPYQSLTPQNLPLNFGQSYSLEAFKFQQPHAEKKSLFTYDKKIGTDDMFTGPCPGSGFLGNFLTLDDHKESFRKIDFTDPKNQGRLNVVSTITKNTCYCFPKPDPDRYFKPKTLIIHDSTKPTQTYQDIFEEATMEADAEAFMCGECLKKWKEKQSSSCRNSEEPMASNKASTSVISLSLEDNILVIQEHKGEYVLHECFGSCSLVKKQQKDTQTDPIQVVCACGYPPKELEFRREIQFSEKDQEKTNPFRREYEYDIECVGNNETRRGENREIHYHASNKESENELDICSNISQIVEELIENVITQDDNIYKKVEGEHILPSYEEEITVLQCNDCKCDEEKFSIDENLQIIENENSNSKHGVEVGLNTFESRVNFDGNSCFCNKREVYITKSSQVTDNTSSSNIKKINGIPEKRTVTFRDTFLNDVPVSKKGVNSMSSTNGKGQFQNFEHSTVTPTGKINENKFPEDIKMDLNTEVNGKPSSGICCCKYSSNPIYGEIIEPTDGNVIFQGYSFLATKCASVLKYVLGQNDEIEQHICDDRCYKKRIDNFERTYNTNMICGRTVYDPQLDTWYSCCPDITSRDKRLIQVTFKNTAKKRIIKLHGNCRNTRYHVVYE